MGGQGYVDLPALGASSSSGGGGVSSVGLALPGTFSVSGSPVTTTGTLTGSYVDQGQNQVFAGPLASSGVPTFRPLAVADIPASSSYLPSYSVVSEVLVHTFGQTATLATACYTFTDVAINRGTDITYSTTPTSGSLFTINTPGLYSMRNMGASSSNNYSVVGISKNCTTINTSVVALSPSEIVASLSNDPIAAVFGAVTATVRLVPGDKIRPHTNTPGAAVNYPASSGVHFYIAKIGN